MIGDIRLRLLPRSLRLILSAFLAIIGFGYLAALGNLYYQFQDADGRPGLGMDDIRATFHGLDVPSAPQIATSDPPRVRSRMLEMVEPGGKMRKHLAKGGDSAIRALITWLTHGAPASEFESAGLVEPDDPAPRAVIERQCLRCHNAEDGERKKSPFGKDGFDADLAMVRHFAAPGASAHSGAADFEPTASTGAIPPQPVSHLLLVAHIHMLSIPMFTLIVSALYLCTGPRRRPAPLRGAIAATPMLMLCLDFAAWWIARWSAAALYIIPVAGALYGVALAVQLLTVFGSMWWGRTSPDL